MIEGYHRMEGGEIFNVLTPEQPTKVRKKVLARRAAAKEEQQKNKKPLPPQ